jgi:YidC/Oxa1 family membrane protein insertase
VNQESAKTTHFPFSYLFDNQSDAADLNRALFAGQVTPDGLGIEFEYSDGNVSASKSFRFKRDSYLSDVRSVITRAGGNGVPHMLAWRGGFGDRTVHAAASTLRSLYFDLSENKLVEQDVSVAEDGPQTLQGPYSFAGIEDTYFAAVFLPAEKQQVKIQTISDELNYVPDGDEEAIVGVGLGGNSRNQYALFVGPKDVDLLRRVNPKLEGLVDFGWFAFIAKPLFLFLNWLNDGYIRNYGWSIVIATILINFALLPLKLSGMKGMKKMSALQPEIKKINDKYKDISFRDPRKAQQNQEVMELYKKHGVNPLGAGCMPLLFQIPFFFAFYKVLSVAIELRGAGWLWVNDLAQHDPWYLLPIVMVGTQFVLQKMTPATSMDPAQQRMMMFMPLVMGFLFLRSPAGLVLYWMTSNLVGILQQWAINKSALAPTPVPVTAPPAAARQPAARQPAPTRTAARKGKK